LAQVGRSALLALIHQGLHTLPLVVVTAAHRDQVVVLVVALLKEILQAREIHRLPLHHKEIMVAQEAVQVLV